MLPIWRLRPQEFYAQELARHAIMDEGNDQDRNILETEVYINRHKKKIKAAQSRERLILSIALLLQAWTITQSDAFHVTDILAAGRTSVGLGYHHVCLSIL